MKTKLENFLYDHCKDGFLGITTHKKAMSDFQSSFVDIEKAALCIGITPLRYKRNQSTISIESQLKLLNSHVSIIGCGGLGGHVAEILTRIGIGRLTLIDFDVFEEHNLNRQNFSNYESLGEEKVFVVKKALEKINPALHVEAIVKKFNPKKDFVMVETSDLIIDALDNPQTKLDLAQICKENSMNFVHGAIAGMNGQFSTCSTLEALYRDGASGIESSIGNPSFSVTFAASIQSAEAIKTILGIGETLKDKILMTNLLENEFIIL